MAEIQAAARPRLSGASVAFVCGTAAWSDPQLAQARKWVRGIQSAAGGGVLVGEMGENPSALAALIADFSRRSALASAAKGALDGALGGLRGHTLVFVTRGIDDALLLWSLDPVASPKDKVIAKKDLDAMSVQGNAVSAPDELAEKASVLTAVRRSIYSHVYFAFCGSAGSFEGFAARVKELTGKSVFWNDEPLSFPKPPAAPSASLGDGLPFFKAPDAAKVALRASASEFLAGSQRRIP